MLLMKVKPSELTRVHNLWISLDWLVGGKQNLYQLNQRAQDLALTVKAGVVGRVAHLNKKFEVVKEPLDNEKPE